MSEPIEIFCGRPGQFTVQFTKRGQPVCLVPHRSITLEVFDTPGEPIITINSNQNLKLFDCTELSQGILTFKYTAATFPASLLLPSQITRTCTLRFAVESTRWPYPGMVVPNYLTARFSR